MRRRLLRGAALLAVAQGLSAGAPAAKLPAPPSPDERTLQADLAARKGAAFLLSSQGKDGSWGSHDPVAWSAQVAFAQDEPAPHDATRNACTALAARALLRHLARLPAGPEAAAERAGIEKAIDRAAGYLLAGWKIGYAKGYSFNVWSHACTLELLCDLLESPRGASIRDRTLRTAEEIAKALAPLQVADGGWGYYAGPRGAPGMGGSTSFTTASAVLALERARRAGVAVPKGIVPDAGKLLRRMRCPDGSFVYSSDHIDRPSTMIQTLGASARTLVGSLALRAAGGADSSDLRRSLDLLLLTAPYLECGRKRIIPHRDAPHNISGYFFFYAYYHAAEAIPFLAERDRPAFWAHVVDTILRTQEKNGSWWDALLYDYGDKWGTAYAVLALEGYLKEGPGSRVPGPEGKGEGK